MRKWLQDRLDRVRAARRARVRAEIARRYAEQGGRPAPALVEVYRSHREAKMKRKSESDIVLLMQKCIEAKIGNTEFILNSHDGGRTWEAGIGNPCTAVALGESSPEFWSGSCPSPLEAVQELLRIVIEHGGKVPDPRSPERRAFDEMIDAMSDDELRAWNAEQARNARPGEIATGILRSSWIAATSIAAEKFLVEGVPTVITGESLGKTSS